MGIKDLLEDEHVQEQMLKFIRKYGVHSMTGKSKTGKKYSQSCWSGICSKQTFYKYIEKDTEFKERCLDAKKYFRQSLFVQETELRDDYISTLKTLGKVGLIRTKKRKLTKRNAKTGEVEVTEILEKDIMPAPFWACRMILGDLSTGKAPEDE